VLTCQVSERKLFTLLGLDDKLDEAYLMETLLGGNIGSLDVKQSLFEAFNAITKRTKNIHLTNTILPITIRLKIE
jgi:hypothetical protein